MPEREMRGGTGVKSLSVISIVQANRTGIDKMPIGSAAMDVSCCTQRHDESATGIKKP